MHLTADQVKEMLHISDGTLKKLMAEGTLVPVNERKPGAKKFYARFDVAAVRAYQKTMPKKPAKLSSLKRLRVDATTHRGALEDVLLFAQFPPEVRGLLIRVGERFDADQLTILLSLGE